ncbi:MAG: hypothetical protein ABIQ84_09640 [Usitatibacter sp.]
MAEASRGERRKFTQVSGTRWVSRDRLAVARRRDKQEEKMRSPMLLRETLARLARELVEQFA